MSYDKKDIIEKKSIKQRLADGKANVKRLSVAIRETIKTMKNKLKEVVTKATAFITNKLTLAKEIKMNNQLFNEMMLASKLVAKEVLVLLNTDNPEEHLEKVDSNIDKVSKFANLELASVGKVNVTKISNSVAKQNIQAGKNMALNAIKEAEILDRKLATYDKDGDGLAFSCGKKIISILNKLFSIGVKMMLLVMTAQVKFSMTSNKDGKGSAEVIK